MNVRQMTIAAFAASVLCCLGALVVRTPTCSSLDECYRIRRAVAMHVDPSLITLVQRHGKQIDVDETTIVDGFTSVSPILLPLDLGGYHSLTVARQSPFSIGITQATLIGALPFEFDDGTLVERSPRPGTFAIDRVTSEFPGRDGQTAFAEKPGAAVEIAGWALAPSSPACANAVEVSVDGLRWRHHAVAIERPDVARAIGDPQAGACGFVLSVPAGAPGVHTVDLAAVGFGERVLIARYAFVTGSLGHAASGGISALRRSGEALEIRGWASDPSANKPPRALVVTVDGRPRYLAHLVPSNDPARSDWSVGVPISTDPQRFGAIAVGASRSVVMTETVLSP